MSATFTEDQRAFQEAARRFARERIAPGYMAREKAARVDRVVFVTGPATTCPS